MMWALHRKGGLMDVQGGVSAHPGLGCASPRHLGVLCLRCACYRCRNAVHSGCGLNAWWLC